MGSKLKALIAGIAVLAVPALGFLIIQGVVAFDHWQRAKEPLICVKSHTVDRSHYGYGLGPDGKYSYHWIFETEDICDKTAPNPYYKGNK